MVKQLLYLDGWPELVEVNLLNVKDCSSEAWDPYFSNFWEIMSQSFSDNICDQISPSFKISDENDPGERCSYRMSLSHNIQHVCCICCIQGVL